MTPTPDRQNPLGARIRAGRSALGLTQAALAAEVGCSAEMLRKFEAGAKRPPAAVVERLADRFGLAGAEREGFLAAGRAAAAPAAPAAPEPPTPWFPRTKLQAPRPRGDLVSRPRLVARLREAIPQARLVLVAAPPGSGKTTLLSDALAGLPHPSAWVALDGDDNDPTRFFAVLLAACAQLAPGAAAAAAPIFQALGEPQPDRTVPVRRAVAALVNALMEAPPAALVLDDLHAVTEPLVYTALEYLIASMPPGLALVVATRHDPPLALGRLRARREVVEIRLPELRFTPTETAELLIERLGLPLSAAELAALHERTEGWAAGLSLLASSLAGLASAAERASLVAHLARTDRHLFDYLAEEVLDHQEPAARDFLLDTAVLPELTAGACRDLTGREDAARALDELYRRNLFLVALDPERRREAQAAYRYHDLFRAFLLERLRRDDPARLRELHRRAAASAADPLRAAEHLLQAERWDEAADVIGSIVEPLLAGGAHYTVEGLIGALPTVALAARPQLRVALGRCALQRWDVAAAPALLREGAADLARAGEMVGQAEALVFLSTALSRAGDLAGAQGAAEQALLLPLAAPRRVELLTGRAWQSLLRGAWQQAAADVDAAVTIGERAGGAALAALVAACSGFLAGLPGALARVERISRLAATRAAPEERALHAGAALLRAWAAIWRDEWDVAGAERERALALLGPGGADSATWMEAALMGALGAALQGAPRARGQEPEAILRPGAGPLAGDGSTVSGNAGGADAPDGEPFAGLLAAIDHDGGLGRAWRISLLHGLARAHWLQGRHDELRAAHRRMVAALPGHSWPTDPALCQEIGALVQLAEGEVEPAIAVLRAVADDQGRQALAPVMGDPRWHLAHAHLQSGQPERARAAAGAALAAVRREEAPGRLRWQGAALVAPLLRLRAAGGPNAEFAAAALERLGQAGA